RRRRLTPPLRTTGQEVNWPKPMLLFAIVQLIRSTLPLKLLEIAPLFPTKRQFTYTGVCGEPCEPDVKIAPPPSPAASLATKSQLAKTLGELMMYIPPPPASVVLCMNRHRLARTALRSTNIPGPDPPPIRPSLSMKSQSLSVMTPPIWPFTKY